MASRTDVYYLVMFSRSQARELKNGSSPDRDTARSLFLTVMFVYPGAPFQVLLSLTPLQNTGLLAAVLVSDAPVSPNIRFV